MDTQTSNLENGSISMPKISVGIPTYNRPEGLQRTLEQITGQTYRNLEIIVSDNATPGENGEKNKSILEEFTQKDNRIKLFVQKENMGWRYNTLFVLEQATGDFFMWAHDDDEWDKEFISRCFGAIGNKGLAFPNKYYIHNRYSGMILDKSFEKLEISGDKTYDNLISYFGGWSDYPFQGLMRTYAIKKIWYGLHDFSFNFPAYIIVIRFILSYGIELFDVEKPIFGKGQDTEKYENKIAPENSGKITYVPACRIIINDIIDSEKLSNEEKARVIVVFIKRMKSIFSRRETDARPDSVIILNMVEEIYFQKNSEIKRTEEYRRLAEETKRLIEEKEAIYNSRSWRITKPLRKTGDILKRILGVKRR